MHVSGNLLKQTILMRDSWDAYSVVGERHETHNPHVLAFPFSSNS
jgi:hypothetical protein